MPYVCFYSGGGGGCFQKITLNYSDEEGGMRKKSEIEGGGGGSFQITLLQILPASLPSHKKTNWNFYKPSRQTGKVEPAQFASLPLYE